MRHDHHCGLVAVVVGVAGVLGDGGSGHVLSHPFAVPGYHVTGSAATVFLCGIVVGAISLAASDVPADAPAP